MQIPCHFDRSYYFSACSSNSVHAHPVGQLTGSSLLALNVRFATYRTHSISIYKLLSDTSCVLYGSEAPGAGQLSVRFNEPSPSVEAGWSENLTHANPCTYDNPVSIPVLNSLLVIVLMSLFVDIEPQDPPQRLQVRAPSLRVFENAIGDDHPGASGADSPHAMSLSETSLDWTCSKQPNMLCHTTDEHFDLVFAWSWAYEFIVRERDCASSESRPLPSSAGGTVTFGHSHSTFLRRLSYSESK